MKTRDPLLYSCARALVRTATGIVRLAADLADAVTRSGYERQCGASPQDKGGVR